MIRLLAAMVIALLTAGAVVIDMFAPGPTPPSLLGLIVIGFFVSSILMLSLLYEVNKNG